MPERLALEHLQEDGLVRLVGSRARTTPRWQAAMARAALALQRAGAPFGDLRLPIASALTELYGELTDEEIARYVAVMLPIEEAELAPLFGGPAAAPER